MSAAEAGLSRNSRVAMGGFRGSPIADRKTPGSIEQRGVPEILEA